VPWKLEDIPLSNFDKILQRFFAELKTCKGEDYEPDSLSTMLGALNRHPCDSGCAHRINNEQFLGAIFRWPQQSEVKVPPRKRAHIIDSDSDQDT